MKERRFLVHCEAFKQERSWQRNHDMCDNTAGLKYTGSRGRAAVTTHNYKKSEQLCLARASANNVRHWPAEWTDGQTDVADLGADIAFLLSSKRESHRVSSSSVLLIDVSALERVAAQSLKQFSGKRKRRRDAHKNKHT